MKMNLSVDLIKHTTYSKTESKLKQTCTELIYFALNEMYYPHCSILCFFLLLSDKRYQLST